MQPVAASVSVQWPTAKPSGSAAAHRRTVRRRRGRGTRLAAAAHVGPPPGGDHLRHRAAAADARLTRAQVDQELVLHRAALAVGVPVVVDRGALPVDPALERLHDARVQALDLGAAQPARRPQRMDARAEQRLVGVDVPDAGHAALVEQERLHRSAAAARRAREDVGRELRVERLRADPLVEVFVELFGPLDHDAGAEPALVDEQQAVAVVEREPHAQVRPRLVGPRRATPTAGSRSSAGA